MDLTIECLKEEDYEVIPSIYADAFDDEAWKDDWYQMKAFDKNGVFVAKINDELVGFIVSFLSKGLPYISVLAVKKKYQRNGIAKQLLNHCLTHWKAYEKVVLHVNIDNDKAINFYQKEGFGIVKEDTKDYTMFLKVKEQ